MSVPRAALATLLVAAPLAAITACDSDPERVCGAWGSAFYGFGCPWGEPTCLEEAHRLASHATAAIGFCPRRDAELVDVRSSAPDVLRVDGWSAPWEMSVLELATGAPGTATLELETTDEVARLDLTVEDVGAVVLQPIVAVVEGGAVTIRGVKTGVTGAPLVGVGGYAVTAPPEVTVTTATLRTPRCLWDSPNYDLVGEVDLELHGDAVGTHWIAPTPAALGGGVNAYVVAPPDVRSVELIADAIYPGGPSGFHVDVWLGDRRTFDLTAGVTCAWEASRPITFEDNPCGARIHVASDQPLDLSCRFDGRVVGTVHVTKYVDFE